MCWRSGRAPGPPPATSFQRTDLDLTAIELDAEAAAYLRSGAPGPAARKATSLKLDLKTLTHDEPFAVIIGNFPYNISTQMRVPRAGATRPLHRGGGHVPGRWPTACAPAGPGPTASPACWPRPGTTWSPSSTWSRALSSPPKVRSSVIRMRRNGVQQLPCDERCSPPW